MSRTNSFAGLLVAASALAFGGTALADHHECMKSKWGDKAQSGSINNITAAKTLAAAKLIKQGKYAQLGIETNRGTPAYPPRNYSVTVLQPNQMNGVTFGPNALSYNDDIVMGWNGVGSQLDGLGHIGKKGMFYDCSKGEDIGKVTGLTRFGIETFPGIATRGIVLDMKGLLGVDLVPEGTVFNTKEIEAAMKRQGIKAIEAGDVVIFHTGWTTLIGKDDKRYNAGEPGLGLEGARYLVAKGVAAVGADTWGVEVLPFEKNAGVFEVHETLIFHNGTFILENIVTDELVKAGVSEFFFTLGPSRLTGAVQAVINPIAVY